MTSKEYFNQVAHQWDEMRASFFSESVREKAYSMANLPISDETVDYVFANMYLHHVESPSKAIKEMVRILKPGGKLIITDLDEHTFEFLKDEHHDRWMGFKREDIRKWFTEAGLKDVIVDSVGENCCAQSRQGDEYARVSIFVASGKK
jgi:SAM-dependent methyltransferase